MLNVLIATHNGAETLDLVLEAYAQVLPIEGGLEVIVVDNASTDATPQILKAHTAHLNLTALRTERRGKNVALNLGLQHCHGQLVVLTDDDAIPDANMLVAMQKAAAAQPQFQLFGGRIRPIWPGECPDWIPRLVNLGAAYAITPPSVETGPIAAEHLWGANMAIRRNVFEAGHRFDESVGPAAGQYIMGSETEFTTRMEKTGYRAWFVSDSIVGHIIRPHQMERDWIIQRGYRLGRGVYRHEHSLYPPGVPMIRGVPRWKYREYIRAWMRHLLARGFGNDAHRFTTDWELSVMKGYFYEAGLNIKSRTS